MQTIAEILSSQLDSRFNQIIELEISLSKELRKKQSLKKQIAALKQTISDLQTRLENKVDGWEVNLNRVKAPILQTKYGNGSITIIDHLFDKQTLQDLYEGLMQDYVNFVRVNSDNPKQKVIDEFCEVHYQSIMILKGTDQYAGIYDELLSEFDEALKTKSKFDKISEKHEKHYVAKQGTFAIPTTQP